MHFTTQSPATKLLTRKAVTTTDLRLYILREQQTDRGTQRLAELEARCRTAEGALRNDERLRTLIGSATDGFLMLDSESKAVEIGKKAWFQRLGLNESKYSGEAHFGAFDIHP